MSQVLESKFVKFLSMLKWLVNSSSNFASSFIVMTHNSSVNFKLKHFLLWIKESHQSPNFETFKCYGENLPNYSCLFLSHKAVFLQILNQSSMSWKVNLLYFFKSNVVCFAQKPIKAKILETFECSDQNSPNSCNLWNNKSFFLQV